MLSISLQLFLWLHKYLPFIRTFCLLLPYIELVSDTWKKRYDALKNDIIYNNLCCLYKVYFVSFQSATWPTQSGKTESQARAACSNKVISSQAYLQCKDFSPDNFTTEIENCVRDVQVQNSHSDLLL